MKKYLVAVDIGKGTTKDIPVLAEDRLLAKDKAIAILQRVGLVEYKVLAIKETM